jgi:hypothetical protein
LETLQDVDTYGFDHAAYSESLKEQAGSDPDGFRFQSEELDMDDFEQKSAGNLLDDVINGLRGGEIKDRVVSCFAVADMSGLVTRLLDNAAKVAVDQELWDEAQAEAEEEGGGGVDLRQASPRPSSAAATDAFSSSIAASQSNSSDLTRGFFRGREVCLPLWQRMNFSYTALLRRVFRELDRNGDGALTVDDFEAANVAGVSNGSITADKIGDSSNDMNTEDDNVSSRTIFRTRCITSYRLDLHAVVAWV